MFGTMTIALWYNTKKPRWHLMNWLEKMMVGSHAGKLVSDHSMQTIGYENFLYSNEWRRRERERVQRKTWVSEQFDLSQLDVNPCDTKQCQVNEFEIFGSIQMTMLTTTIMITTKFSKNKLHKKCLYVSQLASAKNHSKMTLRLKPKVRWI